ncbi:MAG: type II toxin-antitoxin system Phd/YefM family antitoxin [Candidatus Vecturithrix sp.]|jgi:hypothetical protein|nr:type II toxin-antitoxin system Phd/YefM family antitoxin [Candidatus Vecturithrix sp.]
MLQTLSKPQMGETMYRLLEQVIKSQIPVDIEFQGKTLRISVEERSCNKLANLEPHPDCLVGEPEDIVHLDWSGEIHHDLP